jgi:hypothetical protein
MMLFRLLPAICFVAMLCGVALSIAVVQIDDIDDRTIVQFSGLNPVNSQAGFVSVHQTRH